MLSVLKNEEIIAINQDPVVGTAITPFRWGFNVSIFVFIVQPGSDFRACKPDWTFDPAHPAQFWSGQSQNGTVFMLVSDDYI